MLPNGLHLGGSFRNAHLSLQDIAAAREALQKKIFRQLQHCPHSLIVIDEVEVIHPDVIHFIHQFIDTTVTYLELDGTFCIGLRFYLSFFFTCSCYSFS
jgi:hypothetical protein